MKTNLRACVGYEKEEHKEEEQEGKKEEKCIRNGEKNPLLVEVNKAGYIWSKLRKIPSSVHSRKMTKRKRKKSKVSNRACIVC